MSDTLRNNEVLVDIEITAVSIKTLNDWTFPKIRKMTIKKRNRDMKFEIKKQKDLISYPMNRTRFTCRYFVLYVKLPLPHKLQVMLYK